MKVRVEISLLENGFLNIRAGHISYDMVKLPFDCFEDLFLVLALEIGVLFVKMGANIFYIYNIICVLILFVNK